MSNDLVQKEDGAQAAHAGPLGRMLAAGVQVNAGAVAIESERAIAEARAQIQLAKMFPRSMNEVHAEVMSACKLMSLASIAFYTVPQGGQKVTGPSIKLIEQIAASMGNFEWGHRELSRIEAGPGPNDFGRSEVEVFAWDKQKNNRSPRQITVLHVMDTKDGPRKLRDQRDIDNKIANVASKQMRGRLQALLPKWLIEAATEECKKTLAGNNDQPIDVRIRAMTQAFAKFGVKVAHLEQYLGHKLDDTLADELVDLQGVYNAIKEGTSPSEFFGAQQDDDGAATAAAAAITNQAKANAGTAKANTSKKDDAEPTTSKEGKPAESNSKAAKESRRDSGHKDDTAQPQRDEPPKGASAAAEQKPEQEGDVF